MSEIISCKGQDFLIKVLGVLFLSTSLYRLTIEKQRKEELINFGLPDGFDYGIIGLEFVAGYSLLFLPQYKKITLQILLIFILSACVIMLFKNFDKLYADKNSVFTFQPNSMCWVLHLTYLMIIISLVI